MLFQYNGTHLIIKPQDSGLQEPRETIIYVALSDSFDTNIYTMSITELPNSPPKFKDDKLNIIQAYPGR